MKNLISLPLFRENCRRYWGCSVLAFFMYFISSTFIILLDYDHLVYYDIATLLSPAYFVYTILDICIPVVACVIMFAYLGRVNSTNVMHSMPFSRKSLFFTNYLSGLVLCYIPMILNSIVLLIIKKPVCTEIWVDNQLTYGENIYTTGSVIGVLLVNMLIMFFTYSIAAFAGIISGNVVIHLLTSFALNFLPLAMVGSCFGIANVYYRGFSSAAKSFSDIAMSTHPGLYAFIGTFNAKAVILYMLAGIVLTAAAYLLYGRRKLELAGSSYVFKPVKYFIAACFTFFPGVAAACIMEDINAKLYAALIIIALLGFAIGWMIVSRSFKIFNREGLKAFVISAVVFIVVYGCTASDITGYQKRIPKLSDIEYVDVSNTLLSDHGDYRISLDDPDNIKRVTEIHKELAKYEAEEYDDAKDYEYFVISYYLKNNRQLERRYYNIPKELLVSSENMKAIFESDEMDEDLAEFDIFDPEKTAIEIWKVNYSDDIYAKYRQAVEEPYTTDYEAYDEIPSFMIDEDGDKELKARIIKALVQDLKEKTFAEQCDDKAAAIAINLSIREPAHKTDYSTKDNWLDYSFDWDNMGNVYAKTHYTTIEINDNYTHCYQLFEELGWLEKLK